MPIMNNDDGREDDRTRATRVIEGNVEETSSGDTRVVMMTGEVEVVVENAMGERVGERSRGGC